MNPSPAVSVTPREVLRLLSAKRRLWIVPTLACGALAAAYALVAPRYWEASQALVVRQESTGAASSRLGKFADLYEMRTFQETILELAKSQQVVARTLAVVSQRTDSSTGGEPTADEIEKFRERLRMLPPAGGEFGKTEVFYFSVKDTDRSRAIELVSELCRQLDVGLKGLRVKRAEGLIAELEQEVSLAARLHADTTTKLVEFESQVGADLGELRMLHSANSGSSDLRMEVVQVEGDSRRFQTQVRESQQLLELLQAAEKDPAALVATPNSLLTTQPALRRLKDGLVDAQLATARLAGTRSVDHPLVRAASEAEEQIRRDLHHELVSAIKGAEVELQLGRQRLAAAQERLATLQQRLSRLAESRGEYSNRVAAVDSSRLTLDQARQNLSSAKAALAAAESSSLVTRLDKPETGPYPVGLGRTVIAGAGAAAGLMLGLGLVFLTTGVQAAAQNMRRRATDVPFERRQNPPTAATSFAPPPSPAPAAAPIRAATPTRAATPAAPASPAPVSNPVPAMNPAPVSRPAAAVAKPTAGPAAPKPQPAAQPRPAVLPTAATGGLSLQQALEAARSLQP